MDTSGKDRQKTPVMKKLGLLGLCVGLLLGGVLQGCGQAETSEKTSGDSTPSDSTLPWWKTKWSWEYYKPKTGLPQWPELCLTGKSQSPVDIDSTLAEKNGGSERLNVSFSDMPASFTLANNGHAVQVTSKKIGYMMIQGERYNALQFHYHCPSEHSVDGALSDCEMHIVYQDEKATGTAGLAVIGILFEKTNEPDTPTSTFLSSIGFNGNFPEETGGMTNFTQVQDIKTSFSEQLAGDFYHYKGSLTTPPCTENELWFVLKKKAKIHETQYDNFKKAFPNPANNRPVQDLNGRIPVLSSYEDKTSNQEYQQLYF